jgi:hypothetical protein
MHGHAVRLRIWNGKEEQGRLADRKRLEDHGVFSRDAKVTVVTAGTRYLEITENWYTKVV